MSENRQPQDEQQTGEQHANTPSGIPPLTDNSIQARSREDALTVSRRWFLLKAGIALNGFMAIALGIPLIRYLFAPWRSDASYKSWIALGAADSYADGETRLAFFKNPFRRPWDGMTANVACYVRREGSDFRVFAVNCAHLGCPVRWFPQSQLFMCPCHGGIYYADGSRASGPPDRGLFLYPWKIVNGNLQIDAGQMPTLANSASLVNISIGGDTQCRG